jgi:uncharacterized protein (TIGR02246 family)
MGRWTRDELENAFANFQTVAQQAGSSGDWNPWADLFTEDATYIESNYGRMGGREAIRRWIVDTMTTPPANEMVAFPIEWYIIDEARGWITCHVWNRMADPGDGSIHQAYNFTLLKYAGDNKWSYEEDIYDPKHFMSMMTEYFEAKKKLAAT